ncbi:hypothetical protein LDB30_09845 [Acidithiobacillus ferrooxidans]|nr:hypothetical protein LDB30_09845 [Acidithiobacillus ferrooxidans]
MHIRIEASEIAEYAAGFPKYWLKFLFIEALSVRYQINALANTYVRLVEAAITEYNIGIVQLREYYFTHTSINLGALHHSISHFEGCLSNMNRATNCFRKLRRHRDKDPLSVALNAEKFHFATDANADCFRAMRNDIHHLDDLVMSGRLQEGQPFSLRPDGPEIPHPTEANQTIKSIDHLTLGTRKVSFAELAIWLREMAYVAEQIAEFRPSSSGQNSSREVIKTIIPPGN